MNARDLSEGDVAAAWDRNADRWADCVQSGYDMYRELYTFPAFRAFMPEIAGASVIDLGCGEGSNTRRFAELGGRMTGIDISEALIGRARAAEAREPLGIRYEVCSFSRIAFAEPGAFDCALSTMALMDGPDFAGAMAEAHRVLVPGGTLCFSVTHPCFMTRLFEWLHTDDGDYAGIKVGRYFDRSHFVEHWRFGKHPESSLMEPFEVPRFPRTLSDYVNAVSDAGFRIIRLNEPRPDDVAAAAHGWLARWRDHVPLVLFVMARKEGGP